MLARTWELVEEPLTTMVVLLCYLGMAFTTICFLMLWVFCTLLFPPLWPDLAPSLAKGKSLRTLQFLHGPPVDLRQSIQDIGSRFGDSPRVSNLPSQWDRAYFLTADDGLLTLGYTGYYLTVDLDEHSRVEHEDLVTVSMSCS